MDDLLFKSIDQATPATELPVSGNFPQWLQGDLFRNGPAAYEIGTYKLNHWFDGFSVLHKFSIEDGKVVYQSKFLESADYLKNIKDGKITSRHYGTVPDPCSSIFSKFFSIFKRPNPNNANVSVLKKGEKIVAVSDFSTMVEFDYSTLDTKGEVQFNDDYGNGYMLSASHPCYDPKTGVFYNCVGELGPKGKVHFYELRDESLQRNFVGTVITPKHTYFHSLALTDTYAVFIEQPLELNLFKLIFSRLLNTPFESTFKWTPEHGNKFHLLNRKTGEIKSYSSETFFFFHTVNAFDQGTEVVIDLCRYDNPDIIKSLYIDTLREKGIAPQDMSKLTRIVIDTESGGVIFKTLSEERIELPTFDFSKACEKYRYVYGLGYRKDILADVNNQLVKIDIETGESKIWHYDGYYPSEPLFVAAPGREAEDEGVVLSVVLDTAKGNSFLLVLDAKSFTEIARAEAPTYLPVGLHGMFYQK